MAVKAIRPNYFEDFRQVSSLKVNKSKDDDDIHLRSLSNHKGWKLIEEYIDNLIKGLDFIVINLMEQGADYDLIGQRTVAKEIAKEMLNKIKNKVHDSRDIERPDGTID